MYAAPQRQNTEAACFIERAGNAEVYVPMHRRADFSSYHKNEFPFREKIMQKIFTKLSKKIRKCISLIHYFTE